ncbi:MAG: hypothetical protein WAK58_11505 [Trebonia sp.]
MQFIVLLPGRPTVVPAVGHVIDGAPVRQVRGHRPPPDAFFDQAADRVHVTATAALGVEVFTDDPDGFIERAVAAGADGSIDEQRFPFPRAAMSSVASGGRSVEPVTEEDFWCAA